MASRLGKLIERFNGILMGIIVVLLFLQVASRTLNMVAFLWAGEAALWIFVWVVFLGAAVLFHKRNHMIVDIIEYVLPAESKARIQAFLAKIIDAVCYAFLAVALYYSVILTMSVANQYAVSFRLSRVYVCAALPVSIVIMFLFEVMSFCERRGGEQPC